MKNIFFTSIFVLLFSNAFSQADGEPLGSRNYNTIERFEILSGSLKNNIHLTLKQTNRKALTDFATKIDTASNFYLSKIDTYNLNHIYKDNNDLVPDQFFTESARPIFKNLYKRPAYLFDIHNQDIHLQVNPLVYENISFANQLDGKYGFINTRGAMARATIDNKVTLFASATENQVRFPSYVAARADSTRAIPQRGFAQGFNVKTHDFFEPKAVLAVDATKHINLQLGYDKHFIGDGYRSLFLSDNANNSMFLKFNTRFWKINYMNLYQELLQDGRVGSDSVKPKKYSVTHHLSFDAGDKVNIGLFESIVFARQNQFEFHYLNPLIFYRAIEQQIGSPDNAMVGLNYSALIKNRVKLYGQLIVDEFRIKDLTGGNKSWANKIGFQQGAKYINAFGIQQLDLQAEINRVRPYTYMHNNRVTNYTHYGQAIAHPLNSNFTEIVAIGNYQPVRKVQLHGMITFAKYGTDKDGRSWGHDILDKTYRDRPFDNGVKTGQGFKNDVLNFQARASYELKHNLNIDFQAVNKFHKIENKPDLNETYAGISFRWNFNPYDYNY